MSTGPLILVFTFFSVNLKKTPHIFKTKTNIKHALGEIHIFKFPWGETPDLPYSPSYQTPPVILNRAQPQT